MSWKPLNRKRDLEREDPELFEDLSLIHDLIRHFYQRDIYGFCTVFSDIALKLLHDAGYREAVGIRIRPEGFGPVLVDQPGICDYLWHDFIKVGPWNVDFSLQQFGFSKFLVTRFDDEDAEALYGPCTLDPEGPSCLVMKTGFVYDDGKPALPTIKEILSTNDEGELRKLRGLRWRRILREFRRIRKHKPVPQEV